MATCAGARRAHFGYGEQEAADGGYDDAADQPERDLLRPELHLRTRTFWPVYDLSAHDLHVVFVKACSTFIRKNGTIRLGLTSKSKPK